MAGVRGRTSTMASDAGLEAPLPPLPLLLLWTITSVHALSAATGTGGGNEGRLERECVSLSVCASCPFLRAAGMSVPERTINEASLVVK